MIDYERFLSRSGGLMQESAIRRMGTVLAQKRDRRVYDLRKIVRRDFRRHADRNTVGTVDEQVRNAGR